MRKIKAVVFDGDGVLLNSEELHFRAFRDALEKYGQPFSGEDFRKYFDGRTAREGIVELMEDRELEIDPQEFADEKMLLVEEMFIKELEFFPGTLEFMEKIEKGDLELQGVGFLQEHPVLGFVTGLRRNLVNLVLRKKDLEDYFHFTLSADDYVKGKPDPEAYEKFLSLANLQPEQVIGVEDSPRGVEALNQAGIFSIGLATTHKVQELSQAKKVVSDLRQLI